MKQQNESVEKEAEKDYVNVHDNNLIVIDRDGDFPNKGFCGEEYKNHISCSNHSNWREATEEEVIEAFKKHLIHRYGEDWETMKIKEVHPNSIFRINDGSWIVDIAKLADGWNVWNKHGLLYRNGIWVESLEEPKIYIKKAMNKKEKAPTITGIMADFLDSIRAYEHESGKAIHSDERESSEFVDMYFNGGGKLKIEEEDPLFITEDGVEIFEGDEYIAIGINYDFSKVDMVAHDQAYSSDAMRFKHESNADKYILMNKRVFSYNDIEKFQSGGEGVWYDVKAIAKERIEE